uniref:Mto1-like Mto2p-binding domain-containing protein n=1 Tax=Moniliophthora roreri TaxID=221103 RepID=A0A0W0F3I1_MONRR
MSNSSFLQDESLGTHPELSLGSLPSHTSFMTPGRPSHGPSSLRVPSTSSGTTAISSAPLSTPSPPSIPSLRHNRKGSILDESSLSRRLDFDHGDEDELEDGDVAKTPGAEKNAKWGQSESTAMESSVSGSKTRPKHRKRSSTATGKGVTLTLRDQEKHIDSITKENFDLKLRSLHEAEREIERLQRGAGSRARERELEEKLEEREREIRELRKRQSNSGRGSASGLDAVVKELEMRNEELEDELENARGLLQDNLTEIERLQDLVESGNGKGNTFLSSSRARKLDDLEDEIERLKTVIEEQTQVISEKDDQRNDLLDEIEALNLDLERLQHRQEQASIERSESRAIMLEEREEREAVEEDLNDVKDRLAAAMIELQQKEDEIERKNQALDDLIADHQRIVLQVEEEWRGEVDEARQQVDELRDVLAERESESKDLRLNIAELEANTNDLHNKFEKTLAHLEEEADAKDAEIESLNETIQRLGDQIYVLEDENDKLKEENDRQREEEAIERERLEQLAAALKEKLGTIKAELDEMTDAFENCNQEVEAHRSRQEELATHIESLVEELQRERNLRERVEINLETAEKEHEAEIRQERRTLEAKESALQSALNDLARAQSLLNQRESDLAQVQNALQTLEQESKRAGETHTTARFSLQLEVDRLKRDLGRLEDELSRARQELNDGDARGRDRDGTIDQLHAENRDLASQLSAQTQARLNISEKLDSVQTSLKAAEAEIASFKSKVTELETRLSKDQRSLLNAENQYRDQLTERNTLLLTIYQYMDKILGVDKTPKKGTQAETKPFTNFGVFHDNLLTRLKALSQIQAEFDKRCKEAEGRFADKIADMKKQLDQRWKQIDKFETSVKAYADAKATWKRKMNAKEGELEALKSTNAELTAQLSGVKRPGGSDGMEIRSLSTRALNAERRLNNAQNQLAATEEKIATMNQKSTAADAKWEARVKEYETRLKAAEERVKRERQGGKERVAELETQIKSLQRQLELAQKRSHQLTDVMETNKVGKPGSPSTR